MKTLHDKVLEPELILDLLKMCLVVLVIANDFKAIIKTNLITSMAILVFQDFQPLKVEYR